MIEWVMIGALGFFLGCLLALTLAPPLWNRAVKLTTRKLEATMPMSLADIQADKDQLRAEYAVAIRKVEVALDRAKEKATRELVEANKRRVELQVLTAELAAAKGEIQEKDNANRVLQQTIKRRLPDLDGRLKEAKKAITDLESINTELRSTVATQAEALKTARATLHNQRGDIDRLRASLEAGGARGSSKADSRYLAESQRLAAELSRAQEELASAHTRAEENTMLREEMSKLASQILAVTRGQEVSARTTLDITQGFTQFVETQTRQAPVPAWNGGGREDDEAQPDEEADIYAEDDGAEEFAADAPDETFVEEESAAGEPEEVFVEQEIMSAPDETEEADAALAASAPDVADDETVAIEENQASIAETLAAEEPSRDMAPDDADATEDAQHEDSAADDPEAVDAAEEPVKRSRSRSRRRKGRGKTLSERLRGLVATSPETHS